MGGWRDEDGRTATDRRRTNGEQERAHFFADVRYRPLTVLKALVGFAFVALLVFALINMFI